MSPLAPRALARAMLLGLLLFASLPAAASAAVTVSRGVVDHGDGPEDTLTITETGTAGTEDRITVTTTPTGGNRLYVGTHFFSGENRVLAGAGCESASSDNNSVQCGASGTADDIGVFDIDLGAGNDALTVDEALSGQLGGGYVAFVEGGPGDDVLNGFKGTEVLYGGSGDDELRGGAGDDFLFGEGDADELESGESFCVCAGSNAGDDTVDGGEGDDQFWAASAVDGADTFEGGPGSDAASYATRYDDVAVSADGAVDANGHGNDGDDPDGDGSAEEGDDMNAERLDGGDSDDYLEGGAGPSKLVGHDGSDTIEARDGAGHDDVNCDDVGPDNFNDLAAVDGGDAVRYCDVVQTAGVGSGGGGGGGAANPGPTGAAFQLAVAADATDFAKALARAGRARKLARKGKFAARADVPSAGRWEIKVTALGLTASASKSAVVAKASRTFAAAGSAKVTVKLTKKGKKALRRAKKRKVKLKVAVAFTPVGGTRFTRTATATLKR